MKHGLNITITVANDFQEHLAHVHLDDDRRLVYVRVKADSADKACCFTVFSDTDIGAAEAMLLILKGALDRFIRGESLQEEL